ncbi:10942_t:CDS:2 [Diversispora eburnea]|uniref:10942_t:CDS:1 n=1 Tax=Diversispora eburnea TaxID=1213867 RepID=A0A9N9F4B4_9GLOM|nr:10942_t:CDS:2 [Diversispora eburnea]
MDEWNFLFEDPNFGEPNKNIPFDDDKPKRRSTLLQEFQKIKRNSQSSPPPPTTNNYDRYNGDNRYSSLNNRYSNSGNNNKYNGEISPRPPRQHKGYYMPQKFSQQSLDSSTYLSNKFLYNQDNYVTPSPIVKDIYNSTEKLYRPLPSPITPLPPKTLSSFYADMDKLPSIIDPFRFEKSPPPPLKGVGLDKYSTMEEIFHKNSIQKVLTKTPINIKLIEKHLSEIAEKKSLLEIEAEKSDVAKWLREHYEFLPSLSYIASKLNLRNLFIPQKETADSFKREIEECQSVEQFRNIIIEQIFGVTDDFGVPIPNKYSTLLTEAITACHTIFKDPYMAFSILEQIKRRGAISYVMGCNTSIYNELILIRWNCWRDLCGIEGLLNEMRRGIRLQKWDDFDLMAVNNIKKILDIWGKNQSSNNINLAV